MPTNIEHWRFSDLPASDALRRALKRLKLVRLADLNGVTANDFYRVGVNGSKVVRELDELIDAVRLGNPSPNIEAFAEPNSLTHPSQQLGILEGKADQETNRINEPVVPVVSLRVEKSDLILIPEELKDKPLAGFKVSVRLGHIFEFKGFRLLGDLHERAYSDFLGFRNCGKKTVGELRELVSTVLQPWRRGQTIPDATPPADPIPASCFIIPQSVANLNPFDLPLPARLEGIFRREGIVSLGELHGIALQDFKQLKNCGKKTVEQLTRLIEQANQDLVITLEVVDATGSPAIKMVQSLPTLGSLFQFASGSRGPRLIAPNTVVSDPSGRIIYAPGANGFGQPYASFTFTATDGPLVSSPATVAIYIHPPCAPSSLGSATLPLDQLN